MILPFSTQINGKPNYFVEKIWRGLFVKNFNLMAYNRFRTDASISKVIHQWDYRETVLPKLHTIREDKNGRWKAGNKIDFFINCRQPTMFRFAPVLPVVSTQRVFMTYAWDDIIEISIGSRQLNTKKEILEFIHNDGFDSWEDFFNYFYPIIRANEDECFSGKIIHWTDLRY